jgi:hypothetical protein
VNIYYNPTCQSEWDLLKQDKEHVDWFTACKDVKPGDIYIIGIVAKDAYVEPGIYAYGTVLSDIYILEDKTSKHYGDCVVDVCIHEIYDKPIISYEQLFQLTKNYRRVNKIDQKHNKEILELLGIQPILYCRLGWMNNYQGIKNDSIVNGGSYNKDNIGWEVCNFKPLNNTYYGFVETGHTGEIAHKIHIEKLGATDGDEEINNVLVVFIATHPEGKTRIVGWYKNATVFKNRKTFSDAVQLKEGRICYNMYSKEAFLLPVDQRNFIINGAGQHNLWYGNPTINNEVINYISSIGAGDIAMDIKIQQGSTFENLKTFIWLTNEYGVSSSKYLDFFIFNFGQIILNGNFTFNKYDYEQLDELQDAVAEECESNTIEHTSNYGNLFYRIIGTKAVDKIKEEVGIEAWNKLNTDDKKAKLKEFIENFDKYISEGIDVYTVYFDNTPNLIKTDEIGRKYIEIHSSDKNATGRLYEDNSVILSAGSHNKHCTISKETKFTSVSGAASQFTAGRIDGWEYWKNDYELQINIYRTQGSYEAPQKQELDRQAEKAADVFSRIQAEGLDIIHTEQVASVTQPETKVQETIKQYILHDKHINKIGAPVSYNNDAIGEIVSEKEIKVNGHTVNIGEYIYNNKLDTEKLTFGCYMFNTLYKEDN